MIGIYKITNRLNGKSYIGQSIHCGKRLDEHCKGELQFIDNAIQVDGIENFTFEILKETDKDNLSYWEDYYIIKYNTMFPNGYNKKWNCASQHNKILKELNQFENNFKIEDKVNVETKSTLSFNLPKNINDRFYCYIYLNQSQHLSISKISTDLNISRNTASKYMKDLLSSNYLIKDINGYKVTNSNYFNLISKDILKELIKLNKDKIIKLYIILYEYFNNGTTFSMIDLHKELGYNLSKDGKPISNNSKHIRTLLMILGEAGLVKYKIYEGRNDKGAPIDRYKIIMMRSKIDDMYRDSYLRLKAGEEPSEYWNQVQNFYNSNTIN